MIVNCHVDQDLAEEGVARELINRVQKLRKKTGSMVYFPRCVCKALVDFLREGLSAHDPVEVFFEECEAKKEEAHAKPATKEKPQKVLFPFKVPCLMTCVLCCIVVR